MPNSTEQIIRSLNNQDFGNKLIDILENMKMELKSFDGLKEEMIQDGLSGDFTEGYREAHDANNDYIDKNTNTMIELGQRLIKSTDRHQAFQEWASSNVRRKI